MTSARILTLAMARLVAIGVMGWTTTDQLVLAEEAHPECVPAGGAQVYQVLFDFDSASLNAAAQVVINDLINAKSYFDSHSISISICLTGYADRAGREDYNMDLSWRRVDAVRKALITGGIPPASDIRTTGRGESEPAMPTPDGVKEQANRRVDVLFLITAQ